MSIRALAWAWERIAAGDVRTPAAKLVLLRLADHASDEDWRAWPSTRHLAAMTALSRASVQAALQGLADTGLVDIEERKRKDGSATSNSYFLRVAQFLGHPAQSSGGVGQKLGGVGQSLGTPPESPEEASANRPAAKGGGLGAPARKTRERVSCGLVFGFSWQPAWGRWLAEDRAVAILFREGVRDSGEARRIVAEWAGAGDRGFRDGPAETLVWLCRNRESLAHTRGGDERLPAWGGGA